MRGLNRDHGEYKTCVVSFPAQGLEAELAALATGEEVLFVANPGNAGDALIASATYQLFERWRIRYRVVISSDHRISDSDVLNKTVVLAGGGNLVPEYRDAARFIERFAGTARRFVLLPASIREATPLLESISTRATIFCRERYSFEQLQAELPRADVRLADDLAFQLDCDALMTSTRPSLFAGVLGMEGAWTLPSPDYHAWERQLIMRAIKREFIKSIRRMGHRSNNRVLNSFRTDSEAATLIVPERNLDCSRSFDFGVESPFLARYSAHRLLEFLSRFDLIRTDRLHVCIAGLLLAKRVEFFANSYYKNRAVYEHSIGGRFSGVVWRGILDQSSANDL